MFLFIVRDRFYRGQPEIEGEGCLPETLLFGRVGGNISECTSYLLSLSNKTFSCVQLEFLQ